VIPEAPVAVSDEARKHLFATISQQYEPEDARTLITLLGYSTNPAELATKVDLLTLARQADLDTLRVDVGQLRADLASLRADAATKVDLLALARQADLDELRVDVDQLKADVATIQADVVTIKADVATIEADVDQLKADVSAIQADLSAIKADMADLRLDFARVGEQVKDVVIAQSRTHQHWMFGLLTVYTAMAGTLVAIGAIIIS
jgi:polyhydroxyalkanoate synthesis regulator phasin